MSAGVRISFLEAGFTKHLEAVSYRGGRYRVIRFPASVAVIEHPREGVLLFDTGYSTRFYEQTKYFPEKFYALITPVTISPETSAASQLLARGIKPTDVRKVICSHFHADHIAGVADFPRAQYIYRQSGFEAVRDLSRWGGVRAGFLRGLLPQDFAARGFAITDSALRPDLTDCPEFPMGYDLCGDQSVIAVDLPGHVVGQIGLLVRTGDGQRYFLVADACWCQENYRELKPPAAVAKLIFHDWSEYTDTLKRLNAVALRSPDLRIIPCHCERTLHELEFQEEHRTPQPKSLQEISP